MDIDVTKYILFPGYVVSEYDGQRHYITAGQLARLYGVPLSKCLIHQYSPLNQGYRKQTADIHLYPRSDGKYVLPKTGDKR